MSDPNMTESAKPEAVRPADVTVKGNAQGFLQEITTGPHHLTADEPASMGGTDSAPTPYDYLLAGLGACTSMTVGLYARRKKWPLKDVIIGLRHSRIHADDCANCETKNGMLDRVELEIELTGDLTPEQRAKLMEIASKCPVHRTLISEIDLKVGPAPDASK